jgi:flagellum-specific ATP synthase
VDEAIALNAALEAFLAQDKAQSTGLAEGYRRLAEILTASSSGAVPPVTPGKSPKSA